MKAKFCILLFILLISLSYEGPCSITTKVEKYVDCRDKGVSDMRQGICCYLETKSGFKICVEMLRGDIDGKDNFKKTKEQIIKGEYQYWLNDTYKGFEQYRSDNFSIGEIESLRCNNSQYLKYLGFLAVFLILF